MIGFLTAALLAVGTAWAAPPPEEVLAAQQAELDRTRAAVAGQVHLAAFDLLDEMVYGWLQEPLFAKPTPVVLAEVTVPVGLGTGLQAQLENHLSAVIRENPTTNVQMVHCPECTAVVVHSGPEGTVISRGYDNPEVLERIGDGSNKHALFIDIEAEGAWLVMRARLTRLTPELPIVWSHTIATSASTPALLRQPSDLKSVADAREEYLDALRDRGPITIPVRFVVRAYTRPGNDNGTPPPPFLWLQTGVELSSTEAQVWTGSVIAGYSFIPQAYQGLMFQGRISRLATGRSRSLTRPDLYLFAGAAAISVWGQATAPFRNEVLTADELLTDTALENPRTTFGTLQVGTELRINNRVGVSMFLESMPYFRNSRNFGNYLSLGTLDFQSFGTEVTFCF